MNNTNLFIEALARLRVKSPKFFRKLQGFFILLSAIIGFLTTLKSAGINFPEPFNDYLNMGSVIITVAMATLSKFPVEDKKELNDKIQKMKMSSK